MSLATRCTACGTIFRIVEDQLRVSDGWVRCGRCAEVFDARELLFDIDQDAPPSWGSAYAQRDAIEVPPPPPPAPLAPPPAPRPPPPPPVEPAPEAIEDAFDEPTWSSPPPAPTALPSEPELGASAPAPESQEPHQELRQELRQEPRWTDDVVLPPALARVAEQSGEPLLPPPPPLVPEFMKTAQRGALWRRPAVRGALAVANVLLIGVLLMQAVLQFRNAIAAQYPAATAALEALCSVAGCKIQPWQRPEALSIDSTSLTPISTSNHYRLSMSVRNKSSTDVAAPWVDLTLTDASGTPFARRVFQPEMLSPAVDRMRADSDQSLSLSFGTGQQRVSGYKVDIFYP